MKLFDGQALKKLVAERDWDNVEKLLKAIVSVGKGKDPVMVHPCLFIPVYQEWIVDRVEKHEPGPAFKLFVDKVSVLYDIKSDFANEKDLKQQVNRLDKIAT